MARPDARVGYIRAPGFPCPECGKPIVIDAVVLLAAAAIQCENCQLELVINREESSPSLDALGGYMEAFEKAKRQLPDLDFDKSPEKPGRRRQAVRRRSTPRVRTRSR